MKELQMTHPRRDFIKQAALASAGIIGLPASGFSRELSTLNLPGKLSVVFQGDSITDYGRDKSSTKANETDKMGAGYVLLSAANLVGESPGVDWKCYNRGISGNKVFQLAERWDKDCLDLNPDVISILIGVNDFWHTFKHGYEGTVKTYDVDLRRLLDRTIARLPNVKFMLGEPFTVKGGSAVEEANWFPGFKDYQVAARKISDDYKTGWVPYQSVFDEALNHAPTTYWSWDGIHPSFAGCYIMAKAWFAAFQQIYR
jgi:lysophospholipase L1-like esterase